MSKPKTKPDQSRDVETGDELYFQHPQRGPSWGKVAAHGRDGALIDADGVRHRVPWGAVLGHKVRIRPEYKVVDQGEDGLVVEGAKGRRKFVSDPIFADVSKSYGPLPLLICQPDVFKAVKNTPGNSLQIVTDKGGHQVHRWKHTGVDAPKGRDGAAPEAGAKHGYGTHHINEGDEVSFEMGSLTGKGKVSAVGKDGVTVVDDKNREHNVRWSEIRGPEAMSPEDADKAAKKAEKIKEKAGRLASAHKSLKMKHSDGRTAFVGPDKSKPGGFRSTQIDEDGSSGHTEHDTFEDAVHSSLKEGFEAQHEAENQKPIPADKFNAASYAKTHDQADVTAASVLSRFPANTESKIQDAQDRLSKIEQTISIYKKDGAYTAARQAIHDKIVDELMSAAKIEAARPAPGEKPTFTLLGGRGGSGKSALKGVVYDPAKAIVLDADEIKGKLPEYEGWNAAQVHEESSDIFDLMTDFCHAQGLNLVHDATMKTGKKAVAVVNRFKDAGYNIEAHYMHLPRQEAAVRAVDRFLGKTNRYVPVDVVLSNTTNEAGFDDVRKLADKWSFRDNNVPMDHAPILISEGGAKDTDDEKGQESNSNALKKS